MTLVDKIISALPWTGAAWVHGKRVCLQCRPLGFLWVRVGIMTRLTWGGLRYESIGDHAELKAGRWLYHRIGICHVLHRGDQLVASRLGRQVFILGRRIW